MLETYLQIYIIFLSEIMVQKKSRLKSLEKKISNIYQKSLKGHISPKRAGKISEYHMVISEYNSPFW